MTIGHRFTLTPNSVMKQVIAIEVEQKKIIENFAMQGDCIIIGRCADVILKEYHPFNLFVYADIESKMKRCMERAPKGEHLSPAQLRQKIQEVDKNRRKYRAFYTDTEWGIKENFHLCMVL